MKHIVNLLLLGTPLFLNLSCSDEQSSKVNVINGTVSNAENSGVTNLGDCSGTVLSNRWVLTAEHCITDEKIEDGTLVSVKMGTQTVRGSRVLAHPAWDVALVRLESEITMNGNSTTYEREINRFMPSSIHGKSVFCRGYGLNTFHSGFGTLREATLKVISTSEDMHVLDKNSSGQILWSGDSGGSCLVTLPNQSQAITGVASACYYEGETVTSCEYVIATKFREWAVNQQLSENFSSALATGDFNKDGLMDVAVGMSGESGSGRVFIYSYKNSKFELQKTLDQGTLDSNESGDQFGYSLSSADYNKDGFADLAIGAPGEGTATGVKSGSVYIFKGSALGLVAGIKLNQAGLGAEEGGDLLGHSLASGDFNQDGFADLAAGAPGEKPETDPRSGVVFLFKGDSSRLLIADKFIDQDGLDSNEKYDLFGHSLAVGDFNKDGFKDLAVGAPGEAPGSDPVSGSVYIFNGAASGLSATSEFNQSALGKNEQGDLFAWSLASGDLNGDGYDDLAVGVPGESPFDNPMSGYVFTFQGSFTGLSAWQGIDQKGLGGNEIGDWFGASLSIADFNGDGKADLAVGAPGEAPGALPESGTAFLFTGTSTVVKPSKVLGQEGFGVAEKGDWFGGSLVAGDFDKDGRADLVVGAPGEAPEKNPRWGHAFVFKGLANDMKTLAAIAR